MPDFAASAATQQGQDPSAPKTLSRKSSKPKAGPDQIAEIISLHKQGYSNKKIADHFGINGQSVNGVIASARRQGLLPAAAPAVNGAVATAISQGLLQETELQNETTPQLALPVSSIPLQVQPPMNGMQIPQPAPQSSSTTQDDFSGGRPVVGASGGFTGANQTVKYAVERIAPPDGLLGTHYGSFTIEELGQTYGEGTYKVTKHDPTQKFAVEHIQKIGPSYGTARSPNHSSQRPQIAPRPFFQRNWGAQPQVAGEEEQERPIFRPSYQRPSEPQSNAALELARQQQVGNASAMETALAMMGTMHQQSLQQIESARKGGPDNMMTNLMREQQEITNRRWEEERKVQDQRRKDEEEKYQRRLDEDQRRWERDQQAERDRHSRELERISRETEAREKQLRFDAEEREKRAVEERRFLLDLEEKKIQLVRQEADAAQKRLENELTRTREEMKDIAERSNRTITENQEATTRHIEESQKQIQEQLDREREQLEREHKLKEKSLDKQHELEGRMLEIQKANMENSGGDQIFNTINTVIKEVSKGLEKVVDLKKLESMTPEAQIAHVARGAQAPVDAPPPPQQRQQQAPPPQPQPQPQPQAQHQQQPMQEEAPVQEPQPQAQAPAQPAAPSPGEAIVEGRMEAMIRENLQKPFFQDVLREWAVHVESAVEDKVVDATTFANLYLEMMRDPRNDEARQGCAAFATFMKPRSWKKMMAVLRDALDAETVATFSKPEAEEFYKQFKAMVLEQITEYWEQFLAARQQRNSPAQAPQNGTPAAAAPVEQAPPTAQSTDASGQTP